MSGSSERQPVTHAKFALLATGAMTATAALGAYPTWVTAGRAGVIAMIAACVLSLVAVLASFVVASRWHDPSPAGPLKQMLVAMGVRLVVIAVGLAYVLLGLKLSMRPLFLWVGISYLVGLAIETSVFVRQSRALQADRIGDAGV